MFSFSKRKKAVDLSPFIRRICDLTTPNMTSSPELVRAENRYNRAIPTLVVPYSGGRLMTDRYIMGITKDIADRGIGLILNQPFDASEVMLGFWMDDDEMTEPWFFNATSRRCAPIGGGFWTLGVELDEFANTHLGSKLQALEALAAELLPAEASVV